MFLRRLMKDLVLPVAVAITLALLIQSAIAKPYEIPTASMDPTIKPFDRIIANRVIYHVRDISRGDIIVFDPTPAAREACPNPAAPQGTPFVKRVIGLPGDTVKIIWGSSDVEVNGARFSVPAARVNTPPSADPDGQRSTYQVPAGQLFVLGDNRPDSCDSHLWTANPYVPIANVIGQAEVTYWPIRSISFLR